MTQQFEAALLEISKSKSNKIEGIHFAIVLDYFGMIRQPKEYISKMMITNKTIKKEKRPSSDIIKNS